MACTSGAFDGYLGNGDGTFQNAVTHGTGAIDSYAIAAADVNGDGKLDVVVTNRCADANCTSGSVTVFLGNGDGTFKTPVNYNTGAPGTFSVALRDLNGDGKPDIVVTNSGCEARPGTACTVTGSVAVLLGNGDGTFQAAVSYSSGGQNAGSIAVGDLNGDWKLDIAVGNECFTQTANIVTSCSTIAVLLGNGDGTFQAAILTATPAIWTGALELGDIDGDGKLDLVVGTSMVFGSDFVLFGNGDGTFQPPVILGTGGSEARQGVALTDLNGDGKPDLVAEGAVVLLNILPPATTTLLTSSAVPSYLNQAVTFTATVTGQGATPTGNVVFQISLLKPVKVPLVNGVATYNWIFAKTGPRTVTARYLGDSTHAPGSSNVVAQPVNALSMTTTTLISSPNPSMVGSW